MGFFRGMIGTVLVFTSPGILLAIIAFLFAANSRETMSLDDIDAVAERGPVLYNGFAHGVEAYHRRRYETVSPDIAIYGSSRAMQFRPYLFESSFYNLGGISGSEEALLKLTSVLHRTHQPRVIIYVADYWQYLNDATVVADAVDLQQANGGMPVLSIPYQLMNAGRLQVDDVLAVAGGSIADRHGDLDLIGSMAVIGSKGFGRYGSNYDFSRDPARSEAEFGQNLASVRADIRTGTGIHVTPKEPSVARIRLLSGLADTFREAGITLVVVSPPVSPGLYETLQSNPLWKERLRQWDKAMRDHLPEFRNYLDPGLLKSPNCEFIDSWHGGEVTYARLLHALADDLPPDMTDKARLSGFISENEGQSLVAANETGRAAGYRKPDRHSCW